MGPGGHVTARQDPFVPAAAPTPAPAPVGGHRAASRTLAPRRPRQAQAEEAAAEDRRQRAQAPAQLGRDHAAEYATYNSDWNAALAAERQLRGTRAAGARGGHREPAQHRRRRQAHARPPAGAVPDARPQPRVVDDGPLLSSGQYVEFSDSELVWEYYAGQGIELQVLATFGKADGMYTAGPSDYAADGGPARADDPARGQPRRRPGVGVLLPVRRRTAAVDERDVAGNRDRGADPRLSGLPQPQLPAARRTRRCRSSPRRRPSGCGSPRRSAPATCSTRSPRAPRSSTPSCSR